MNRFFNYTTSACTDLHSMSVFAFDPSISSLKEVLMYELQHIAYYITKISELEVDTDEIRNRLIKFIAKVVVNLDFKRETLNVIIEDLKDEKRKLEEQYIKVSEDMGLPYQTLKTNPILDTEKMDVITAINQGERQSLLKNLNLSKSKKNLYDIMMNLVKNTALYLVEVENYDKPYIEGEQAVLRLLNATNFMTASEEKLKNKIYEFSKYSRQAMVLIKKNIIEKYGPIVLSEVDLSIKPGKSILVSGHFFPDLELVLDAVKDTDINVYTHSEMLVAHSLEKFQHNRNLVGHYQHSINSLQLDFASFPGAILVTKNSQPNVDIIRGRVYSLDPNPAFGMTRINESDINSLIDIANNSKGFLRDTPAEKIKVGFDKKQVDEKLEGIISKIKNGDIKHLFMIDLVNSNINTLNYIKRLLEIIPQDTYAISLTQTEDRDNVWFVNSYAGIFIFNYIIEKLEKEFDMEKLKFIVFLTQCNYDLISHLATLHGYNITKPYLCNYCPSLISPSLIEGLKEVYGLNIITQSPEYDLKNILSDEN